MRWAWIDRVRGRRQTLRKYALLAAVAIFGIGLCIAIRSLPENLVQFRATLLAAYAIMVPPAHYLLQAADLRLAAKAGMTKLSWKVAIEAILYSNIAAFLPIPGGFLTRVAALRAAGISMFRSSAIILTFTAILGTVSFAYAGVWLVGRSPALGAGALLIALIGVIVCSTLVMKARLPVSVVLQSALLRLFNTLFESVTLILIFAAVGVGVGIDQTAVLLVSGFAALVLSFVPAGIGIREGIMALLSPLVAIDPAVGFLAAAAARVAGMTWLAVIAGLLLLTGREPSSEATTAVAHERK